MRLLTRRSFITHSALIAGGAVGTLALGSGAFAPRPAHGAKVTFLETQCGTPENTGKKILVAYASMHGSTGDVAEAIGKVLCDNGASVDIRLIENVKDPSPYDAAIIGSAVKQSKWLRAAFEFMETHQKTLSQIPVAYFMTCLTLVGKTEEARQKARTYLDPVLNAVPDVKPYSIGLFAGVLDYNRYSWLVKAVMKHKMKEKNVKEGDYRDWGAIQSWAKGLALGPTGVTRVFGTV